MRRKWIPLLGFILLMAGLVVGIILTAPNVPREESISDVMVDAVLHENNKISLFGLIDVNPSAISALVMTLILLTAAALIRIFVIPKFKICPGRFQAALEKLVSFFDDMAKKNSPRHNRFIGAYIFSAGTYIFCSTVFELFGFQAVTTEGVSISLPAPLSDINGAIAMGFTSYFVILFGGLVCNGIGGLGGALKEFSLPISMSFRLFGALLSGLLVTELVYYYMAVSFIIPVLVGILFTLLHALIQTYVLTMLTSVFYGEVTEPPKKKKKPQKTTEAVQTL